MKNCNKFNGDPKDIFDGLLHRSDFNKGGLLFSTCLCRNEVIKKTSKINVDKIIKYCRTLKFDTILDGLISTKKIIKKFFIQSSNISTVFIKRSSRKIENVKITKLKPRSKP